MRPVRICDILFNLRILQMLLLTYLLSVQIVLIYNNNKFCAQYQIKPTKKLDIVPSKFCKCITEIPNNTIISDRQL